MALTEHCGIYLVVTFLREEQKQTHLSVYNCLHILESVSNESAMNNEAIDNIWLIQLIILHGKTIMSKWRNHF